MVWYTTCMSVPVWGLAVFEPAKVLDFPPQATVFMQASCLKLIITANISWSVGCELQSI